MVTQIRRVESALGDGIKRLAECERDTIAVARKSVVSLRQLPAGARLVAADLGIKRPGTGIAPRHRDDLIGRVLARPVQADEPLSWEFLA